MSPSPKLPLFSQITPQRVLSVLRQPSAIAVLASIAVHGLIAVTLPLLPMKSEEPKKPRAAKVVALTPAERSRLPSGFGSGSGLKSGNSLLSDLPPSLLIPPPSPLYTYPTTTPIDPYPVEQTRPDPVVEEPRNPNPKNPNSPQDSGGNGGGGSAELKKKLEEERKKLEEEKKKLEEEKKKQAYLFDPTDISYDDRKFAEFAQNLSTLSKGKMEKDYGKPQFVAIPYTEESCRYIPKAKQEKKFLAVTAIIDPDGKLVEEPKILVSSGYKPLNEAAISYVANKIKNRDGDEFKPSKNGNYKGIFVNFEVDPESVCSAKP